MKTNDEWRSGRREKKKVSWSNLLPNISQKDNNNPEPNEFLQCHSNKSVLVGFINYAFQTWEIHLIKSVRN